MKKVTLLHNPTAGDKEFSKNQLLKIVQKQGFDVTYVSVKKKNWDEFSDETDFLIVAGGDGTVRRVAKALMKRKRIDKQFPIAILPHGTANNIAGTLQIDGKIKEIVGSWDMGSCKKFDIGKVRGLEKDMFFLEGFGLGILPRLIKVMEKLDEEENYDTNQRLKIAQAVLYDIVLNYKPHKCRIIADGSEHIGEFIMVEVINTRRVGPSLELSSIGDPGDGELEIVLIPADHQEKFKLYLLNHINGGNETFNFTIIKAKKIEIEWEGDEMHIDDERIKAKGPVHVKIDVLPHMLDFMVNAGNVSQS